MQRPADSEISIKIVMLSLIEWVKYFLSKWVLFLSAVILGALIGFLIFKSSDKKFLAETTFVLEEGETANPLAATLGINTAGKGLFTSIDNIIWLYQSKAMLRNVLLTEVEINGKTDLLINYFLRESKMLKDYPQYKKTVFGTGKENNTIDHNAVINICIRKINKDCLELGTVPKTENGVSVKFTSKDPFLAKAFNETLVKNVNSYYINSKVGTLQQEIANMNRKLAAIRKELDQNIYDAASTAENTPYPNPNLQTFTVPTRKKTIDVQVNTAAYAQLIQSLETLKIELTKSAPLITIVDSPQLPLPLVGVSMIMHFILGGIIGFMIILLSLFLIRYFKMIMA